MSLRFAGVAMLSLTIPLGACAALKTVAGLTVAHKPSTIADEGI